MPCSDAVLPLHGKGVLFGPQTWKKCPRDSELSGVLLWRRLWASGDIEVRET